MNIIEIAFNMAARVQRLFGRVRSFYYSTVLLAYRCGQCNGRLSMISESRCRCAKCGLEFDPTVEFQRCSLCGGKTLLKVSRYLCRDCGQVIDSRFVFDGRIFDAEYFRQKMTESRRRKKEKLQQVRQMLAESRSQNICHGALNLDSVPGLLAALNGLTAGIDEKVLIELRGKFDLYRYQQHIRKFLEDEPVDLRGIPAIIENARLDLIWRFIAVIFMGHENLVDIEQQDQTIWVSRHVDRQGQDIFGETQKADGFEGLMC